jgi:hypothetical protein
MRIVPLGRQVTPTGSRFGRLTIIGESFYIPVGVRGKRDQMVVVQCDCGEIRVLMAQAIVHRHVSSCGCLRREIHSIRAKRVFSTHGSSYTSLYRIWNAMRFRCTNSGHRYYKHYGGKGVRVCNEWQAFEPFRDWALSHGYALGLTIDRLDSAGNYTPTNCQWLTRSDNTAKMHRERGHTMWPPRDLPIMPKNTGDWWRKVASVPRDALIQP